MRLVQIQHSAQGRRVAQVSDNNLRLLNGYSSVYACALAALQQHESLLTVLERAVTDVSIPYDAVYAGQSEWKLLPAFDYPDEPARCLVSGTGLTHRKSADNRNAMHASENGQAMPVTDSMRIYNWGVEGGRPTPGEIGAQPEWFYKGNGAILRAHGESLDVPAFAEDGGEEAELAGIYIIDEQGTPRRIGFAQGNEFSDHEMEAKNYLYLAPSKLRTCALGPELVIDNNFSDVPGTAILERNGETLWSQKISSGEANMVHTLENLEHHHFKYAQHRQPGDAHIHFFGTGGFSFGSGIQLEDGDDMIVTFETFGRPLRNPIRIAPKPPNLLAVHAL